MSGSIYIQPRIKGQKLVYSSTPSIFRDVFEKLFGGLPMTLTRENLYVLEALSTLSEAEGWASKDNGSPWKELHQAVLKYDRVEVRMEY